ncbi:MAG: hypothetical protein KatS3mg011_0465 [Acidimicrobiia bacterium]|nr:MAG: hypothetical protein KatS3mg011_0465 [Acidimicrobiia bacterium]
MGATKKRMTASETHTPRMIMLLTYPPLNNVKRLHGSSILSCLDLSHFELSGHMWSQDGHPHEYVPASYVEWLRDLLGGVYVQTRIGRPDGHPRVQLRTATLPNPPGRPGDEPAVRIGHRLPLAEAATAHRMLEGRETTGKVLLLP